MERKTKAELYGDLIQINANWGMNSDSFCVTLWRRTVIEKPGSKNLGKEKWTVAGNYNNYSETLKAMINKDIQGLDKFENMVERLNELERHIDQLFKGVKYEKKAKARRKDNV